MTTELLIWLALYLAGAFITMGVVIGKHVQEARAENQPAVIQKSEIFFLVALSSFWPATWIIVGSARAYLWLQTGDK